MTLTPLPEDKLMSTIIRYHRPAVKPTRRTPRPETPFGLGIEAPLLEAWTDGPFLFVLSEPATDTYRYQMDVFVGNDRVDVKCYDGTYFRQHAKQDAAEMAEEHREFHRQYEIERFEAWMAEQDRIPAICGGAPIEATEADRRWWAETSDREMRQFAPKRGRGVNVTDEDVIVATGCCG